MLDELENPFDFILYGGEMMGKYTGLIHKVLLGSFFLLYERIEDWELIMFYRRLENTKICEGTKCRKIK